MAMSHLHALAVTLALVGFPAAVQEGTEPSEPPAGEHTTPVVVAGPLDTLFEGALVGARDGEDFNETPGYRKLLESLAVHGEEELIQKARTELDHADAVASPDRWRGAIVHVRGLVVWMKAYKLATPIGSHEDVFRAIVAETDGSEGVVVDFLQQPPKLELGRDVVDVEGVFFRTVQYESEARDKTQAAGEVVDPESVKNAMATAPYLIARAPRRLDPETLPGRTSMDPMAKLLIGAALAFVVVRVLMSLQRARSRAPARLRPGPPPPTRPS
jgi:hypothetical protein